MHKLNLLQFLFKMKQHLNLDLTKKTLFKLYVKRKNQKEGKKFKSIKF